MNSTHHNSLIPFAAAVRRSALGLTVGISVLCVADASFAQERTENSSFIGSIMHGLGAVGPDDKGIDYRERSPLVVPPKLDLPPPENAQAGLGPNWPKDPDEIERKKRAKAAANGGHSPDEDAKRLSFDELNKGRLPRGRRSATSTSQSPEEAGRPLSPSELGYGAKSVFSSLGLGIGRKEEETAKFVAEPPRTTLTEPPVGYQTPSPKQRYGVNTDELSPEANKPDPSNPLLKY